MVCSHPIVDELPGRWPHILGYNLVQPKKGVQTLEVGGDPLLVVGSNSEERVVAFTTDSGQHSCPTEFAEWEGYVFLWRNMVILHREYGFTCVF